MSKFRETVMQLIQPSLMQVVGRKCCEFLRSGEQMSIRFTEPADSSEDRALLIAWLNCKTLRLLIFRSILMGYQQLHIPSFARPRFSLAVSFHLASLVQNTEPLLHSRTLDSKALYSKFQIVTTI